MHYTSFLNFCNLTSRWRNANNESSDHFLLSLQMLYLTKSVYLIKIDNANVDDFTFFVDFC